MVVGTSEERCLSGSMSNCRLQTYSIGHGLRGLRFSPLQVVYKVAMLERRKPSA